MCCGVDQDRTWRATGLAVGVALVLCAAGGCTAPPVEPDIRASDTPAKIPAIMHAAYTGDQDKVPELVAALDSEDPAVRLFAFEALVRMTGHRFDYVWYATREQRQPALAKWRAFRDGKSVPGHAPGGVKPLAEPEPADAQPDQVSLQAP